MHQPQKPPDGVDEVMMALTRGDRETLNTQQTLALLYSLVHRPGMYTLSGTYLEVIAFARGFYGGIAKHNVSGFMMDEVHEWHDFETWLAERLNTGTDSAFRVLFEQQGEHSLAVLLAFVEEYRAIKAESPANT